MENHLAKYFAFVTTVETGSFTKAAVKLNYTQLAVSKMVADLESDFGAPLLERSRNGVQLTAFGNQVFPLTLKILGDYRALQGYVEKIKGVQTGTVRIGTFASVAIHWLPNIIAAFQKDYPGIKYELLLGNYNEIERWIETGRVDCGFLRLPAAPGLESILLQKDEYLVALPPNHPLSAGPAVAITQLENQPFLLLEQSGKTEVSSLLAQYGVRPDVRFTTWEDFAILAMVEKGLGIGILPALILKRSPYRVAVRPLQTPYYRQIGLAFKSKSLLSPAAKRFIEYLPFREKP